VAHASRYVARALLAICLGATGTTVLTAAPAAAEPSVDQAESKVDKISHDRKVVAKKVQTTRTRLFDARIDLASTRAAVRAHRTALAEVEQRIAEVEAQEGATIGRALTAAAEVTSAPDPAEALVAAQADLAEDELAPEAAEALQDRLDDLQATEARQVTRVRELTVRYRATGQDLSDLRASLARAYETLEDAREEARASRSAATPAPAAAPVSGGAAAAVAYAMAQVGDSYVYGAVGPDSFDCSGLTMAAWAQAGVALPHSSGAQMGSGTPVSIDALQPGDLVFYYSPVSHVGMYIGNGQLVHAANPSTDVQVTSVSSMPISGAVRPG
jgi:cell wall-associated NlpC family hydrolase